MVALNSLCSRGYSWLLILLCPPSKYKSYRCVLLCPTYMFDLELIWNHCMFINFLLLPHFLWTPHSFTPFGVVTIGEQNTKLFSGSCFWVSSGLYHIVMEDTIPFVFSDSLTLSSKKLWEALPPHPPPPPRIIMWNGTDREYLRGLPNVLQGSNWS